VLKHKLLKRGGKVEGWGLKRFPWSKKQKAPENRSLMSTENPQSLAQLYMFTS
jgi:hypothetical protein